MTQYAKLNRILETIDEVDPVDMAREAWSRIRELGLEEECLFELLHGYVKSYQRTVTHAIEQSPRTIIRVEEIGKDAPFTPTQQRIKDYLSRTMYFGGNQRLVIATATKADWVRRRRLILAQVDGFTATLRSCERIIELFDQYRAMQTKDIPIDAIATALWPSIAAA
jgi:hypothetical protein